VPAEKLPWLEYSGQTTAQILACKHTHAIPSLLCVLEEAILFRQSKNGARGTTASERTLLAVMALSREVNNGGYHQFFFNSSRKYAPTIVATLRRIGCQSTAALTAQAIDALALHRLTVMAVRREVATPDIGRDRKLDSCDRRFYQLTEIEPHLFAFVEEHAHRIVLEPTTVPPRPKPRGFTLVTRLHLALQFAPQTDYSFDAVRRLAAELAVTKAPGAAAVQIDGAAYLYLFGRSLKADDLAGCGRYAPQAFELAWEDTTHCIFHFQWVEKLIAAGQPASADGAALQYLRRLATDDTASEFIGKRIGYWGELIRRNSSALPESAAFLRSLPPGIAPLRILRRGLVD